MGTMDRNTLRWLLQKMEKEAQNALAKDGSFLEALRALRGEVDRDFRVKSAVGALQDEGLTVHTSFVPRIRIRLHARQTVLTHSKDGAGWTLHETGGFAGVSQTASDPAAQELLDAASAVIAASPSCRHLDAIVNEAVQANGAFERLAGAIERAGYELQIRLDLTTCAQVRVRRSPVAEFAGYRTSSTEPKHSKPLKPGETPRLSFSTLDLQFLKELGISPA